MLGAPCLLNGQYSPGKAQQVCWSPNWSPTPHLIIWYVLVLSCFYIQSRFPSKLTTGSPLWNLENNIRTKDQELRLSKFNFMKARCFYAATEQQCCRAAFGEAASPREQGPGTNFTDPKAKNDVFHHLAKFCKDLGPTSRIQKLKFQKMTSFSLSRKTLSFAFLCIPLLSDAVVYRFTAFRACPMSFSTPLTYGYIFGCVNRIQLYSINHPFEEKQKKANQNDSRKSDFGKNTKKGKYEKYKCRTQWKIQRTLCFFACVVALFLSFFWRVFAFFQKKEANKNSKKSCFLMCFCSFLVVSFWMFFLFFAFSNCILLHALGDLVLNLLFPILSFAFFK